jgi:hypothetical protein
MATITARIQNRRGDIISGAYLLFFDKTTGDVKLAKPERSGDYTAELDSGKSYSAIATKPGYVPGATDISVPAGGGSSTNCPPRGDHPWIITCWLITRWFIGFLRSKHGLGVSGATE